MAEMPDKIFGFRYFTSYEKDGEVHFKWRLKWWYAVWLILKTMFQALCDREIYREHNSEPGSEWLLPDEAKDKIEGSKEV